MRAPAGYPLSNEAKEATMSDPRRDPRLDPPPIKEDEIRSQRLNELESSNAMWGWVAGAVVLALVLVFVFTRGQVDNSPTALLPPPAGPGPPYAAGAFDHRPEQSGAEERREVVQVSVL